MKSLLSGSLLILLLMTNSTNAEMSTDEHINSLAQEYAKKNKVKKEQLGSWESCFKHCMIQDCSYCQGQGSCGSCDSTTGCWECKGTCVLAGGERQQSGCASLCAAKAVRPSCW